MIFEIKTKPLIALVYRESRGSRHYSFDSLDTLAKWCAKKPYRDEFLKVSPIGKSRKVRPAIQIHASCAPAFMAQFVTSLWVVS
jgi:hypothetical protein